MMNTESVVPAWMICSSAGLVAGFLDGILRRSWILIGSLASGIILVLLDLFNTTQSTGYYGLSVLMFAITVVFSLPGYFPGRLFGSAVLILIRGAK
jgi:hypothetical protein